MVSMIALYTTNSEEIQTAHIHACDPMTAGIACQLGCKYQTASNQYLTYTKIQVILIET